jgi:GAF domain-containing protein
MTDTRDAIENRIDALARTLDTELRALAGSHAQQRKTISEVESKLARMGEGLAMLGSDPQRNIDVLVESVAAIVGSPVSLYNRLEDEREWLATWSIFNAPPDYVREDPATGHICYEATMKHKDRPTVLEDLTGTVFEESDGVVKKYGLKAYLGFPVTHRGRVVGSLCTVDTKPRRFSTVDVLVLHALSKSMSIEEERKQMERELEERLATIEMQADALRARTTSRPRA